MNRLGILLSGRGSNFEAIGKNVLAGNIAAEIAVVISNISDAPGLAIARSLGFETLAPPSKGVGREEYDGRLTAELTRRNVDLVCLAGYMRLLTPAFIQVFRDRILNIHPSLLPAFPGLHAQRQALEYGVKITGCTVHLVDEGIDSGPIVLQAAVPVLNYDTESTLSHRILEIEHRIYSEAIRIILAGHIRIENRRTVTCEESG